MVVAEIPLWVTHRDTTPSQEAASAVAAAAPSDQKAIHHAASALALLQDDRAKCAIYSIDAHPSGTKFATAGGDGTVRLWSTATLFASSHQGGRYDETAGYVSTSNSSSSEASDNDDRGNKKSQNGAKNNANDSSEDESSGSSQAEKEVHDLSLLVRSKKTSQHKANEAWGSTSPSRKQTAQSASQSSPPQSPSKQKAHQKHRLLCTLSAHTGSSVLAVRFSNSGKYLASAGDDGCVCIYAPSHVAGMATGNLTDNSHSHVEHWSRILLCRGHNLDVVDLAWAPDDSHLVSCSLDRETPIIVWKCVDLAAGRIPDAHQRIRQPYKVLGADGVHTSTVKGVTFDPAGSYLASSGDDPAVCIWRAHDDWGLEKRIDSSSGIFRKWREDDTLSLSSQSLFRRISWSTDGSFICSTNSVVKNKHVASTIAREGWAVATDKSQGAGAATLVGHKQPVVASRVSSQWLDISGGEQTEDEEPEYATLLALGDKRGFLTVWSTRKSKPVFKVQCSESKCTVTDLAWGRIPKSGDLFLFVSLLDGQVLAIKFRIPGELGPLLTDEGQSRVFSARYGIDRNQKEGNWSQSRLLVGERSGPQFIENAFQMSLERKAVLDKEAAREKQESNQDTDLESASAGNQSAPMETSVRSLQRESTSKSGKKRVQPVLMNVSTGTVAKKSRPEPTEAPVVQRAPADALQEAVAAANRATTASHRDAASPASPGPASPQHSRINGATRQEPLVQAGATRTFAIEHKTERLYSLDLPLDENAMTDDGTSMTLECLNTKRAPLGSNGTAMPCINISITREGSVLWRDEIPGSFCSAICVSSSVLAVGTSDGAIQLFGTSSSMGWSSAQAFRICSPLVVGSPIVELKLQNLSVGEDSSASMGTIMFCVMSDGSFGVYNILPKLSLSYKGTIMPAMSHISLAVHGRECPTPKLSKVQITDDGDLLLLLSLRRIGRQSYAMSTQNDSSNRLRNLAHPEDHGAGGSIQGFLYNRELELWVRVSDSRFICSDFYKTLPSTSARKAKKNGVMDMLDESVRAGQLGSSLKPGRGRSESSLIFSQTEDESANFIPTRAHCEDRIACAMMLNSGKEVKHWFLKYFRLLVLGGHETTIRVLIDMIHGSSSLDEPNNPLSWMSSAVPFLAADGPTLIKDELLPMMGMNRTLQRLAQEVQLEIKH